MRTQGPGRSISDFRYSPLVAALAVALAPQASLATTKTVTYNGGADSSAPTPAGSLREALEYFAIPSNCTGSDLINFAFSNGPFVVNVSEPLPIITCGKLVIDGTSGPNPGDRAIVQSTGGYLDGMESQADLPATVTNLQVTGFSYGTALYGNIVATGNVLSTNDTGYDPGGYSSLSATGNFVQENSTGIRVNYTSDIVLDSNQVTGNSSNGIYIRSSNNVAATRNTISANYTGVYVSYGGSTVSVDGNSIVNNLDESFGNATGVYLSGSSAVVNNNLISGNDYPVYIEGDAGSKITNNRIGTTDDGLSPQSNNHGIVVAFSYGSTSSNTEISGNVISANRDYGIDLSEFTNVKITGNLIGLRGDGAPPGMGNSSGGIIAYCGTGIQIAGNVISSNSGPGIEMGGVAGGGQLNVSDNKIGVAGDGITALGNSAYGIALYYGECSNFPSGGTNGLLIKGNTVAYNGADGVLVSQGTGNQIIENLIHGNSEKNLNLGSPGPLPRPNDALDADGGPNNGQNYPVIDSAARDWTNGRTVVNFTLDGPVGDYRIDIYSNDASSNPGGSVYHGNTVLPITVAGPTSGSFAVTPLTVSNLPNNFSLTATAVATGDTSEFSPTAFIDPMPDVTVTPNPPNLDFGQVPINSASPPQTITLRSSGNEPYRIDQLRLDSCFGPVIYGGPFMISSTCVPSVDYAPGQSCSITGRFAPLFPGTQSITIADCDNTFLYGGSRLFTLTGVGGEPPPVNILPSEFDFGSVLAGSKSPPQQFVISNPSAGVISIGPVTVSNGAFVIDSSTCGTSMNPGSLCTALVSFVPTQPQRSDATLSVASTAASAPASAIAKIRKVSSTGSATAHLTGLGIQVADIQLPSSIDFGSYTVGTPPIRQNVEIVNTGNAIVSFSNLSVTGPFTLTNNCPLNIAPGERCIVALDFSTTSLGNFTGVLAVVSNATGGTRSIPLMARSVAVPAAQLSVSPSTISFGDRLLGTTSATQRVTIRNIGNAPAVITSITSSTDFLVSSNTCTLPLAPTSTCFADVALRPVGFGPRSGQLFVNSDVAGSPNVVGLFGTGCRPPGASASRLGMGSGFSCAP